MPKRNFTIFSSEVKLPKDFEGRYEGSNPWTAAKKAARKIYEKTGTKKKEIRFTLRELGTDKTYKYIGIKQKLDQPVVVKIKGSEITYNHKYHIKSCRN